MGIKWMSLPSQALAMVLEKVEEYDVFAFAMTCKRFQEAFKRGGGSSS